MNPLIFWAIRDTRVLDHSSDDEHLAHQRLEHGDELAALDRDGRWVAAIRRWSQQDAEAATLDGRDQAHESIRAAHGRPIAPHTPPAVPGY
ncbi:hypothetical protein WDJ51_07290 [Rathayibacter sp. YIM 133350]|uniref:hypothetical protein n=1 Tax=Rathayibacter sp. YIM 133350 TaxID=3131992 RepID=UPI00307D22A9